MIIRGNIGSLKPFTDCNGRIRYRSFLWYRNHLFIYNRDESDPLTVIDRSGTEYRPVSGFLTDGASVYSIIHLIPFAHLGNFDFPVSYFIHDCIYQLGGLEVRPRNNEKFEFLLLSKGRADAMLFSLLAAEGATWWDRAIINFGVGIGGGHSWDAETQDLTRRILGLPSKPGEFN